MAYANTFMRSEMKFVLNEEEYSSLMRAAAPYITADEYGKHTICNIYCDSDNSDLIRASLDKPVYKEKLRLRSYGRAEDSSPAFLEIKKKFKGTVYKRRLEMPYKTLFDYITEGTRPENGGQVLEEIDYLIKLRGLKPKIVICYDRRAFFGSSDNEFRMTFDSNIRSRADELDLRLGDRGELLSPQPFRVMEVKTAAGVPMWLTSILSRMGIYQGSFSKYGSIYAASVKGTENNDNRSDILCSTVS